jgi:hypothetical protein
MGRCTDGLEELHPDRGGSHGRSVRVDKLDDLGISHRVEVAALASSVELEHLAALVSARGQTKREVDGLSRRPEAVHLLHAFDQFIVDDHVRPAHGPRIRPEVHMTG